MAKKINSKRFWLWLVWALLLLVLIYTRFVNLGWGLPFPFHPDERNMANSITQLSCHLPTVTFNLPESMSGNWDIFSWVNVSDFNLEGCFNPNFFAYGQLPLYAGYLIALAMKFFSGNMGSPIDFQDATLALRYISSLSSLITVLFLVNVSGIFFEGRTYKSFAKLATAAIAIFVPYAIQFAHFGTTESLLMMFYTALIYMAIKRIAKKISDLNFVFLSSITLGLALATKISAAVFALVPVVALIAVNEEKLPFPLWYRLFKKSLDLLVMGIFALVIFLFFSPHNLINYNDFIGSMKYESGVALGQIMVFYTRQFIGTVPVIFQMEKVFPYVLGISGAIMFVIGFFFLSWKDRKINFLRLSFLGYFLTSAFVFAKWSRFMAPVMPVMTLFISLAFVDFYERIPHRGVWFAIKTIGLSVLLMLIVVPGFAYLSVYENKDVRATATDWIYENIPAGSNILSETGNVVDIPLFVPGQNANYNIVSFDFYGLDVDQNLQSNLQENIRKADYIFIPSRRIFSNHSAEQFPMVAKYYEDLFSGKLGFEQVAEFTSYPRITFEGKTLVEFADEQSEETWTVFDHPVIRIFKRI